MPQIIKPVKTQIVTKDGECAVDISIELTININSDGLQVNATATPQGSRPVTQQEEPEPEDTLWAIQEFGGGGKVKFGKTEKGDE